MAAFPSIFHDGNLPKSAWVDSRWHQRGGGSAATIASRVDTRCGASRWAVFQSSSRSTRPYSWAMILRMPTMFEIHAAASPAECHDFVGEAQHVDKRCAVFVVRRHRAAGDHGGARQTGKEWARYA